MKIWKIVKEKMGKDEERKLGMLAEVRVEWAMSVFFNLYHEIHEIYSL